MKQEENGMEMGGEKGKSGTNYPCFAIPSPLPPFSRFFRKLKILPAPSRRNRITALGD